MVNASRPAANTLTKSPSTTIEPPASVRPNASASPGRMRPRGIGRPAVRLISASTSASNPMLSAPAAPAPTAMHNRAVKPITGCRWPGADTRPTSAVNTTSDITRGFISATYSPTPARLGSTRAKDPVRSLPWLSDMKCFQLALLPDLAPDTRQRASADARQNLKLMERRGRRQRPFERRRTGAPRVVGGFLFADESLGQTEQEHQQAACRNIRPDRGHQVPRVKGVGIVDDAARHAGEPEEVLWEEHHVDADESQPEVQLAQCLRVHVAGHLGEPIVPAGEDGEHGAEREHVVEMRHHVIGVLQHAVDPGIGEHDAGDAADGEQEDEADGPQQRGAEIE